MLERQFRKYFKIARDQPGITGDQLLQLLERRLDNVVYRLSFVDSRRQGRQMVTHRHYTVNGKRADIPSYLVKPGDTIAWKHSGDARPEFIKDLAEGIPKRPVPPWLEIDVAELTGRVLSLPDVSDIDTTVDSRLIVEFYSR